MKENLLAVLVFAIFFAFIVLAVQFNSATLPALILGSVPVCLGGLVLALYASGLPLAATVIIGVLVIVAATVNDGVLLLVFADELQQRDKPAPVPAMMNAAKIRLRLRVMTTMTTIVGFVPLALNLEEGGDMLQPMTAGAIGGLGMEVFIALFFMPCSYVIFAEGQSSDAAR